MRKKTSIIWKTTKAEFEEIVKTSETLAEVLIRLGSTVKGGNYKTLKKRLTKEKTNCSHIAFGLNACKGRKIHRPSVPLADVMIEHSTYSRKSLKERLMSDGLLLEVCGRCGQQPKWNGTRLVLVLDHINGECDDHRFENLQLLCPNCNSQMPTFCGRHKSRIRVPKRLCKCGRDLSVTKNAGGATVLCRQCSDVERRKVKRPSLEALRQEVLESSFVAVGSKYGVSDNTIRKWLL